MRISGKATALVAAAAFAAAMTVGSPPAVAEHNSIELVTTGPAVSRPYPFENEFNRGQKHSADGRHVFFETRSRLVPQDEDQGCSRGDPYNPDDCRDVYERFDGQTRLVSYGGNGAFDAHLEFVSADGQKAYFTTSEALVPEDTNAQQDVYQWTNGTLELVSGGPAIGAPSVYDSAGFAGASEDGSKVFFETRRRLVPADQNNCVDIYVRSAGTTRLISTGPADTPFPSGSCDVTLAEDPDAPWATIVSRPDGAHYFYYSYRALVPQDRDGTERDIYEYFNGATRMVSTGPNSDTCGGVANGPSSADWGRASGDGSRVFFTTNDSLVPEDTNCRRFDTYERDASGVRLLAPDEITNFSHSTAPIAVSDDGAHVILSTNVGLSPQDTNNGYDLYDRFRGSYELLSTGPVDRGASDSIGAMVSRDGLHVYFATQRQLVPEDTDNKSDIYERYRGVTRLVTTGTEQGTTGAMISPDGTRVFFGSYERLVPEDTDNQPDVYEWRDGHIYLVTAAVPTPRPVWLVPFGASEGGSRVLITTDARLTPDDTNDVTDLYAASIERPPDCSNVTPSPAELWPPNGKLHEVALSGAGDPDGDQVALTITGVTQDEPTGRFPDARLGPAGDQLRLRAKRSGHGDGRVYRIAFKATDGHGGECTGTSTVGIPRSRHRVAVDSAPPSYDSLLASP